MDEEINRGEGNIMNTVTANQKGSFVIEHNGPYRVLGTTPHDQPTNVPVDAGLLKTIQPISVGSQHTVPTEEKTVCSGTKYQQLRDRNEALTWGLSR